MNHLCVHYMMEPPYFYCYFILLQAFHRNYSLNYYCYYFWNHLSASNHKNLYNYSIVIKFQSTNSNSYFWFIRCTYHFIFKDSFYHKFPKIYLFLHLYHLYSILIQRIFHTGFNYSIVLISYLLEPLIKNSLEIILEIHAVIPLLILEAKYHKQIIFKFR